MTPAAASETLVVFREPLVQRIFEKPQLSKERSLTRRLLHALPEGDLVPRHVAEQEPSMTQAVAYATLRAGEEFVCLQRRSGNRKELRGRRTIVFGGHVNPEERDGLHGLKRCLMRELDEEFGLEVDDTRFVGILADPTSQVGRQHLGFMFEAHIDGPLLLDRRLDNGEYGLLPGGRSLSDLTTLLLMDRGEFDPWSRLVLAAYGEEGSGNRGN
jgi:predicted NUDIX family phosphoesterase